MEKTEARATLKKFQGIVHNRSDGEVEQVIEELRAALPDRQSAKEEPIEDEPEREPSRSKKGGRDRMQRAGRNRNEK